MYALPQRLWNAVQRARGLRLSTAWTALNVSREISGWSRTVEQSPVPAEVAGVYRIRQDAVDLGRRSSFDRLRMSDESKGSG